MILAYLLHIIPILSFQLSISNKWKLSDFHHLSTIDIVILLLLLLLDLILDASRGVGMVSAYLVVMLSIVVIVVVIVETVGVSCHWTRLGLWMLLSVCETLEGILFLISQLLSAVISLGCDIPKRALSRSRLLLHKIHA